MFLRRGTLFAVAFDAGRLEVRGTPVAVLDKVAQALTGGIAGDMTGAGQFAVAPTGALAFIGSPVVSFREWALAIVDRRGRITQLPGNPHAYWSNTRLSPDGSRLAVVVQELTDASPWLYDLGRETLTPLARGGEAMWPLWSPDGSRLAFSWIADGQQSLAVQPADGTSAPQPLVAGSIFPASWTRDGRQLVGVRADDIVVATLDGDTPDVRPVFETPYVERWPAISPDGRWLAYGSDVSGRDEVYVRPFPGPGAAVQVSVNRGSNPAWNPRGNELFFVGPRDAAGKRSMLVAEFSGGAPPPPGSGRGGSSAVERPRIGRPRPLFEFDEFTLAFSCTPVRCSDVSIDGQRFYVRLTLPAPPRPPVTHIDVILNWVDQMKAKVAGSGRQTRTRRPSSPDLGCAQEAGTRAGLTPSAGERTRAFRGVLTYNVIRYTLAL